MPEHIVKQGEHLIAIARREGFPDFQKVWDCHENADTKKTRKNPNVLYPGDRIHIPDLETKTIEGATDQRHCFRLKEPQLSLRLVLKDANDDPIDYTECTLTIEGESFDLTTDSEGKIEQIISNTAQNGTLSILGIQHTLQIGYLDPKMEVSGQQARLSNLGYYLGPVDGDYGERLLSAVEEFQCDHGLSVDGICGPKTQAKLVEIHGC